MVQSEYNVGALVRVTGTFRNLANVLADPTTVTGYVQSPSGAETTPSVTKDSTGVYHMEISATLPGRWYYRLAGVGDLQAAAEGWFSVKPTAFS